MVGAWLALGVALFLLWPLLPIAPELAGGERAAAAALTAMLLVGVSPAVTIAVIAEGRARGPLADLADRSRRVHGDRRGRAVRRQPERRACACSARRRVPTIDLVGITLWALVGSIAFGAACGALFALYLRYVGREITVVLLVLCGVLTGFARAARLRAAAGRPGGRSGHSERPARRRRRAARRGRAGRDAGARPVLRGDRRVDARRSAGDGRAVRRRAVGACACSPCARASARPCGSPGASGPDPTCSGARCCRRRARRSAWSRWSCGELPDWGAQASGADRRGRRDQPAHRPDHLPRRARAGARDRPRQRRPRRRLESRAVGARTRRRRHRFARGRRPAACRSRSTR